MEWLTTISMLALVKFFQKVNYSKIHLARNISEESSRWGDNLANTIPEVSEPIIIGQMSKAWNHCLVQNIAEYWNLASISPVALGMRVGIGEGEQGKQFFPFKFIL